MEPEDQVLLKYEDPILKCSECGFCQASCPVFTATLRPAFNARGKMMLLKEVLEGNLDLDEGISRTFYACTTCQACFYGCPSKVPGHEIIQQVRKALYKKGCAPASLLGVRDNILAKGNVFAGARKDRIEIYPPVLREKVRQGLWKRRAETILFMGCLPSYMDMKIIPGTFKIMDAAGVDYTLLGDEETCCGFPLYLMGFDAFEDQAKTLMERLQRTGAHELVTPCAGCYKTFATLYPEWGALGIRVYHVVQYVDKLRAEGRIAFKREVPEKITYHDPCDLGRACHILEEPRNVIQSIPGVQYVEMARNRLDARCCGGGGGMQGFDPDLALKMAANRVQDAFAIEAHTLVSGCPACKDNLRKGWRSIPKEQRRPLKIMDISELIRRAIE